MTLQRPHPLWAKTKLWLRLGLDWYQLMTSCGTKLDQFVETTTPIAHVDARCLVVAWCAGGGCGPAVSSLVVFVLNRSYRIGLVTHAVDEDAPGVGV